MTTLVPGTPLVGESDETVSSVKSWGACTVTAPFVTVTCPLSVPGVAGVGTVTWSVVAVPPGTRAAALPLNFTAVTPMSPTPVIVTSVPATPTVGGMPVTEKVTLNGSAEGSEVPAAVCTVIGPDAAPGGTTTLSDVAVPVVGTPKTPPAKSTRSAPPNPLPLTVIVVPVDPDVGAKEVIFGSTVNEPTVDEVPPALVTEIGPLRAAIGIVTRRLVRLITAKAAATPPTFTDDVPPKVFPLKVRAVATKPCVGGNGSSVGLTFNVAGLEALPLGVVTDTRPVMPVSGIRNWKL